MKIYDWKLRKLLEECQFQFSRSSGPGGQKVNKTESKVELRWPVAATVLFHQEQKDRIQARLSNSINKEGELVLASDQYRSREQNKRAVCERFHSLIEKALHQKKKRKKTKPTKSSIQKRLDSKKKQGDKKRARGKIDY